jgi:hypothetical protein
MRVLIFQAAASAISIAAMTRFADEVRAAGYNGGLRSLPAFRREKEPADRIIVALSPSQAEAYKNLGTELVATFNDTDRIIPVELPEEDEDLKDFDFASAISGLDDATAGFMTMDQLKAEAIERGLEVRADSTREELEHAIGIDIHPGPQAADRVTDRQNAEGTGADRIGLRTSTVLPTTNGLDLERMNDEQLQGVAAAVGVKVVRNASRAAVINKITKTFAEKTGAPADSSPQAPAEDFETDLAPLGDDTEALKAIAEKEEIDLGRATAADTIREKIVEARKAKAEGGSNG